MSAKGQKRLFSRPRVLVRFALQSGPRWLVGGWPLGATSGLMHRSKNALFNHLVGAIKQLERDFEAARSGRGASPHCPPLSRYNGLPTHGGGEVLGRLACADPGPTLK